MTAIELADRLDTDGYIYRADSKKAAAMLRKQAETIKQLRDALGDISYAVEWGGDVKEAQEKADAALAATEEFK